MNANAVVQAIKLVRAMTEVIWTATCKNTRQSHTYWTQYGGRRQRRKTINTAACKFITCAGVGVALFLIPLPWNHRLTIGFGIITELFTQAMQPLLPAILLCLLGSAAIGPSTMRLIGKTPPANSLAAAAFSASPLLLLLRWLGFVIALGVFFHWQPTVLWLPDTGITVVHDIGLNILVIYFIGLALTPLLTRFGLMEYAGVLAQPILERWLHLPGRAAVDALTSIVSASAIGLLVTLSQYERGVYSVREASVIACSFSVVSIPFSLLIAKVSGIEALFVPWYCSVLIACIVCALVLSRCPPLSRLPRTYAPTDQTEPTDSQPKQAKQAKGLARAWQTALVTASKAPSLKEYAHSWVFDFFRFSMAVIGPSIACATLALVLVFHTPVVDSALTPLSWLLQLVGLTQASEIAPGLIVGFADQFLPALIAGKLDSTYWQFVLAGLSVCQLVFMSEFGLIVLRSNLPLGLGTLFAVFTLRTLVSLPILLLLGGLFVA